MTLPLGNGQPRTIVRGCNFKRGKRWAVSGAERAAMLLAREQMR